MASIISAGTTSGTALNMAGDTSGVLELATNGSTTALTIDTSQNVGIGTTSPTALLNVNRTTTGSANAIVISRSATNSSDSQSISWQASDLSLNYASIGAVATATTGTLTFNTASSGTNTERMRIDSNGNLLFNSGYGSVATAYGCRAWIKFDGTTNPPTINASGNVSSITDNGTGDYTLNFTTAMPDTNYNLVMSMAQAAARLLWTNGFTTTTARVVCANTAQAQQDGGISVSVFR
jgi:hypothetical protein